MRHGQKRSRLSHGPNWFTERVRGEIAGRLQVDLERIRYGPLDGGGQDRLSTAGKH